VVNAVDDIDPLMRRTMRFFAVIVAMEALYHFEQQ
jgi:hypothetical protein